MLDYVETKDEMMSSLNQFHTYYKKVKSSLKSDYLEESIEKIIISIKNKLEYVAHYKFMSVSTFGFLGDSIVETTNSGMKYGYVSVGTNMTINISGSTPKKLVRIKVKRKVSKYLMIILLFLFFYNDCFL